LQKTLFYATITLATTEFKFTIIIELFNCMVVVKDVNHGKSQF